MSESDTQIEGGGETASVHADVGRQLRLAREAKGLSVAETAEALKLGVTQVEALENDDWQALPGTTFTRGFVRNYGRLVGLDPESLMDRLDERLKAKIPELVLPESTHVSMPEPSVRTGRRDYLLAFLGVVLVVVAGLVYFLMPNDLSQLRSTLNAALQSFSRASPETSTASGAPVARPSTAEPVLPPGATVNQVLNPGTVSSGNGEPVTAGSAVAPPQVSGVSVPEGGNIPQDGKAIPAPNTAPPGAAQPVHLSFNQESWVEVRDRRGNVIFSQNGASGSERDIDGQGPFSLVIGNAKGVQLRYRGQAVDLAPHTRGEVARLTLE